MPAYPQPLLSKNQQLASHPTPLPPPQPFPPANSCPFIDLLSQSNNLVWSSATLLPDTSTGTGSAAERVHDGAGGDEHVPEVLPGCRMRAGLRGCTCSCLGGAGEMGVHVLWELSLWRCLLYIST